MTFSESQCPCMRNGDGRLLLSEDVPRWAPVYGGLPACVLGIAEVLYIAVGCDCRGQALHRLPHLMGNEDNQK